MVCLSASHSLGMYLHPVFLLDVNLMLLFSCFTSLLSQAWHSWYCWVKLKLLLQVYHQHLLTVRLWTGHHQWIRSTVICHCMVTGSFVWKKFKELLLSGLAHPETGSVERHKSLSCLCWLLQELRVGWDRQIGEFFYGRKGLRSCTKPDLSQWMGHDEGEQKSLGKGFGVAASQDKNSSDGGMGLFSAPDQLDRRLSSFQWAGFCICCMAAISV